MGIESGSPEAWSLTPLQESERILLLRLLQLYFYDFSEIDHEDLDEGGNFAIPDCDRYGRLPGHDAWLLRVAGKPAGFALIDLASTHPGKESCHYVREFHVLRAYRRRGFGAAMATALFDRYPGAWLIEQIGPNVAARHFWRSVIDCYTGGRYREYVEPGRRVPLVFQEFTTFDRVAER